MMDSAFFENSRRRANATNFLFTTCVRLFALLMLPPNRGRSDCIAPVLQLFQVIFPSLLCQIREVGAPACCTAGDASRVD
jgi:hypothetical protein